MPGVDALANLAFISGLTLTDNPELTNVDALAGLFSADHLRFEQNAKLQSLPEFSNLYGAGSATTPTTRRPRPDQRGVIRQIHVTMRIAAVMHLR